MQDRMSTCVIGADLPTMTCGEPMADLRRHPCDAVSDLSAESDRRAVRTIDPAKSARLA
jgi:hypothetical protein